MASTSEALASAAAVEPADSLFEKLAPGPGRLANEVQRNQRARVHRAMLELVDEKGYGAVTARGLAARAGVSTRTFYERFEGGKESCFLSTYDALVRGTMGHVTAAQADQSPEEGLRTAISVIVDEALSEPKGARLALIEAYAAGSAASRRAQRTEGALGAIVSDSFAYRQTEMAAMPQPLLTGISAGLLCALRSALVVADTPHPPTLAMELSDWLLSYEREGAAGLSDLERQLSSGGAPWNDLAPGGPVEAEDASNGDRQAILNAVTKLVAAVGFKGLKVADIRAAAGIPRRRFSAHFEGVNDCFATAFDVCAERVVAQMVWARERGSSPVEGVCLSITALCELVAKDPGAAAVCFGEAFAAGTAAAERHDRFIARIAVELFRDLSGSTYKTNAIAERASAGAVWGVLRQYAPPIRRQGTCPLAASLSYAALAPWISREGARPKIKNIASQNLIDAAKRASLLMTTTAKRGMKVEKGTEGTAVG